MINLGSNSGDRRLNLSRAVNAVAGRFGMFEVSHAVESEPWGFDSENKFLNIGMMFSTDLEPLELLHELQEIERKINPESHRNPDGSYRDRAIDIDIIAIDDVQIDTPELTIPHRHLAERPFFLTPLMETASAWRHPATGLTAMEMLAALAAKSPR